MNRRVVVAGSSVTASQLKDLFRQIEDGSLGFDQMQDFLDRRNPFQTNVGRAIEILGESKVITKKQSAEVFDYGRVDSFPNEVRYREERLRDCARSNKEGYSDYFLHYGLPLSLRQQRTIVAADPNNPSYFNDSELWWMDKSEDWWAKSQPEPGYYLIDLKSRYHSNDWEKQSQMIASSLGGGRERADERVFSQALIAARHLGYKLTDERLSHWGMLNSRNNRVWVSFYRGKIGIHACPMTGSDLSIGVCLSHKFDI